MFFIIPRTRKGLIVLLAVLFVICAGAAVFSYFSWSSDQQALKENGQPDFNTLAQSDLKDGLIVKGTIGLAIDAYAEEYGETLGMRTSEKSDTLYYLIPIYDTDAEGYFNIKYFITYKAEPGDFDTMAAIVAQTASDTAEMTSLNVENARISDLPGDIQGFLTEYAEDTEIWGGVTFYDWCAQNGIFETTDVSEIKSKVAPFMIDRTATAGTDLTIVWVFAGAAGLCLIIFLILVLRKKPINGMVNNTGNPDIMRPQQ